MITNYHNYNCTYLLKYTLVAYYSNIDVVQYIMKYNITH